MRYARSFLVILTVVLVVPLVSAAPLAAFSPSDSRLGINLWSVRRNATELPFVDLFRLSDPWFSQRKGAAWNTGPRLDLDEHGWIRRLEPGCYAETALGADRGRYPAGSYVCLYDGDGVIDFWNIDRIVSRSPGRIVFESAPEKGAIFLRVSVTNPMDYIRNIRVVMPGFERTYETDPFHPLFMARWRQMGVFRFMDWMETNGSEIAEWADRPKPEDATWAVNGVPLEVMIDLANRQGVDPWFCMPHKASDDYVRRFAEQVARDLSPDLRAYVEYSNEIWNSGFEQTRYAAAMGARLGYSHGRDQAPDLCYSSVRSVEIFRIWQRALGGTERLVRVMASQAANPWVSEVKLSFRDAYKECDALAVAPYVSLNVGPSTTPNAATVAGWNVEHILDYLERTALPKAVGWIKDSKKVAEKYRIPLIAYEAGQHAVGVAGSENVEALTKLLLAANRHPRMGVIYTEYLDAWLRSGGSLCVLFSSMGTWTKWGAWGLLEHYEDDTPKFRAVNDWNLSHPLRAP